MFNCIKWNVWFMVFHSVDCVVWGALLDCVVRDVSTDCGFLGVSVDRWLWMFQVPHSM